MWSGKISENLTDATDIVKRVPVRCALLPTCWELTAALAARHPFSERVGWGWGWGRHGGRNRSLDPSPLADYGPQRAPRAFGAPGPGLSGDMQWVASQCCPNPWAVQWSPLNGRDRSAGHMVALGRDRAQGLISAA